MRTFEKGRQGEQKAAAFLEGLGYKILEKNYRTRRGEIDLIAEKNGVLSFVEVKSWRKEGLEDLEYSIDVKKRKNIINTSKSYLLGLKENLYRYINYDIIFIDKTAGEIEFLENAFTETGA